MTHHHIHRASLCVAVLFGTLLCGCPSTPTELAPLPEFATASQGMEINANKVQALRCQAEWSCPEHALGFSHSLYKDSSVAHRVLRRTPASASLQACLAQTPYGYETKRWAVDQGWRDYDAAAAETFYKKLLLIERDHTPCEYMAQLDIALGELGELSYVNYPSSQDISCLGLGLLGCPAGQTCKARMGEEPSCDRICAPITDENTCERCTEDQVCLSEANTDIMGYKRYCVDIEWLNEGDTCTRQTDPPVTSQCLRGLFCDEDTLKCVIPQDIGARTRAPQGGVCATADAGIQQQCMPGFDCRFDENFAGTCGALVELGQPCRGYECETSLICIKDAGQEQGICSTPRTTGEPCVESRDCVSLNCDAQQMCTAESVGFTCPANFSPPSELRR